MRRLAWTGALLLSATPAMAQTGPAAPTAAPAAQASPAALAAARSIAARLVPSGAYKQILSSTMDAMNGSMGEMMKAVPLREIAVLAGASAEDAQKFAKVDMAAVMAIYDPYWEERQNRMTRAMIGAIGDLFGTMEPEMREAMAQALSHRFSLAELRDLDRYFASPTGAKFASNYMTLVTDPAITDAMKNMMPRVMQQMPHAIELAQKATADLPPPRKLKDLTPAERANLAKALGVTEDQLQDPKSGL